MSLTTLNIDLHKGNTENGITHSSILKADGKTFTNKGGSNSKEVDRNLEQKQS